MHLDWERKLYSLLLYVYCVFSSFSSKLRMKSFSTTSLVGELEKEDRIKELENMLDAQKLRIENQNQRILELEENEKAGTKAIPMTST